VVRRDAARLLGAMGLGRCELSIIVVDDATIRGLNREFRGKDTPTDVLSFSQLEEAGGLPPNPAEIANSPRTVLGDVVISIDTAICQAEEFEVTPAARLRRLLIHGVLHLIGYDHERSLAEARRMFARERELEASLASWSERRASPSRRSRKERTSR